MRQPNFFGGQRVLLILISCVFGSTSLAARLQNHTFCCAQGWAQKVMQELRQDAAILAEQRDQRTRTVREKAQEVRGITWLTTDKGQLD